MSGSDALAYILTGIALLFSGVLMVYIIITIRDIRASDRRGRIAMVRLREVVEGSDPPTRYQVWAAAGAIPMSGAGDDFLELLSRGLDRTREPKR